jgi:hypothetical protein
VNAAVAFIMKAVDRATGPIRAVRSSLGALRGRASQTARSFGLHRVADSVRNLGKSFVNLGRQVRGLFGGAALLSGGGLMAALGLTVRRSVSAGDALDKLSQRSGVAVEQLQELAYAAERSGATGEEFEAAIRSLTKNIGEAANGTGEALELFEALGVKLTDSAGKTRNVGDVYVELADKIAKIEDPAQRAAVAQKLMEEAGAKLVPSMLKGSAGLAEMAARARELGIVTAEQARASAELTDRMTDAGRALEGAGHAITAKLLPVVGPLIERFTSFITANRELIALRVEAIVREIAAAFERFDFEAFVAGISETVASVRGFIEAIGGWKVAAVGMVALLNLDTVAALLSVGKGVIGLTSSIGLMSVKLGAFAATAIPAVVSGIGAFATAFKALTVVLIANPIGAVIAAVAALGAAVYLIYENWDSITAWAKDLWAKVGAIFDDAIAGIMSMFEALNPARALREAINALGASLPGWMKTGLSKMGIDFDTPDAPEAGNLPSATRHAVDRAAGRQAVARGATGEVQGEIRTRIEVVGAEVKNVQTRTSTAGSSGAVDIPVDVGMNFAASY